MTTLVLRLCAPMQSWGTSSRFTERDTGREPSKSGVIGLLAAAMGRRRDEPLDDLTCLQMAVRIDRPGVIETDYQTAGGGTFRNSRYGVPKASGGVGETVLSRRHYLADSCFHVALSGDEALLLKLNKALLDPAWPLFLGRKAFVPTPPLCLGIFPGGRVETLEMIPWTLREGETIKDIPQKLHVIVECDSGEGIARSDVPLSFVSSDRRYGIRFVKTRHTNTFPVHDVLGKEVEKPCISPD